MSTATVRQFGTDVSNAHELPSVAAAIATTVTCKPSSVAADLATPKVAPSGRPAPLIISVEAAIGTGKSSLLRMLQQRQPSWRFVQEPVDEWQSVGGRYNLLQAFYEDKSRYSFSFQTFCVLSRIESVTKVLDSIQEGPVDVPVVVLERSWFSDRNTFGEMLREQGNISPMEWELYNEWYKFAVKNSPAIHGHVYLECNSDTCMKRLHKRHRTEEVGVTQSYQDQLIAKHEEWLSTVAGEKVCRINVDSDFLSDEGNARALIAKLDAFIDDLRRAAASPATSTILAH